MKKILPILLILQILAQATAFAQAIWNGKADIAWYNESQTEFTISTAEQLAGLAKLANNGNSFKGKIIALGKNIMLNDTANWQNWASNPPKNNWEPIGIFSGIFDGNGFAVNGAYINSPDKDRQGLFGLLNGVATIKNLGIAASYINGKDEVGGLVGISDRSFITSSYSTAHVAGREKIGGLVGMNAAWIINSYSKSSVAGHARVGGLAGYHNSSFMINNYSTAIVAGQKNVGGIVGENSWGKVINSYYDKKANGQEFADNLNRGAGAFSMNAWIYSVGEGLALSNRVDSSFGISSFFESGKGTEAAPYMIHTAKQLENLSWLVNLGIEIYEKYETYHFNTYPNGMYFKLGQNIMLNDTANWQNWASKPPANKWTPIGADMEFRGNFDGNGFIVSGVYVNDANNHKGLFGKITATIKNLGVTASYIKGKNDVGGIAGISHSGEIANSYFTGKVAGDYGVGGLVGISDKGRISNSYFIGNATGNSRVGGLAGSLTADDCMAEYCGGEIVNSYSIGTVAGKKDVGGLAGHNFKQVINNSYSAMAITGKPKYGKSYESKTTKEMKQKSTYEGWDFEHVWGISADVNGGYPYLLH